MFTGIIEEVARIKAIKKVNRGRELQIECSKVIKALNPGDSLAVNGICFTIEEVKASLIKVFASAETLEKTTVLHWHPADKVNLERSLRLNGRLDGHLVMGHIDFIGKAISIRKVGQSRIIRIGYPSLMANYFVYKGSVAVDGISLTISALGQGYFENSIIPFTWKNTSLKNLTIGRKVNVEADIIGKYVESFLKNRNLSAEDIITKEYHQYRKIESFRDSKE